MGKEIEKKSKYNVENLTPGGPGRPKGSLNKKTIMNRALERLAELNEKTADELDEEIVSNALLQARKGNYSFYKDYMDRHHGPVVQRNENLNVNVKHELPQEDKDKLDELLK